MCSAPYVRLHMLHCCSPMKCFVKAACLLTDMVCFCRSDRGTALLCQSSSRRLHACLLQGLPGGLACCQAHLPPVQGNRAQHNTVALFCS